MALRRIVDKHGDDWLPEQRPSNKSEFVYFVERLRARVASAANELSDRGRALARARRGRARLTAQEEEGLRRTRSRWTRCLGPGPCS